jgi:hypothetical protein
MTTLRRVEASGLHKRPQMEQILNYLDFGQEKTKFPNRQAKFIRNHPYMTDMDFMDVREEQMKAWEEQQRKMEGKEISQAQKDAMQSKGTQNRSIDNETWDANMNQAAASGTVYDAEAQRMDTQDRNKKDVAAQTASFALRHMSETPSAPWYAPPWFRRGAGGQPEPSAPARDADIVFDPERPLSMERYRGRPGPGPGPKGSKVPAGEESVVMVTGLDGERYPIMVNIAKGGARVLGNAAMGGARLVGRGAMGGARLAGRGILGAGRAVVDTADFWTFDVQGRARAWEEHTRSMYGSPTALMDRAAEENQEEAALRRHMEDFHRVGREGRPRHGRQEWEGEKEPEEFHLPLPIVDWGDVPEAARGAGRAVMNFAFTQGARMTALMDAV